MHSPSRLVWLAALASAAVAQTPEANLAQLAAGAQSIEEKAYETAVERLSGLAARMPKLGDYARFYLGSAYFELKNYPAALTALTPVYRDKWDGLTSPFQIRAVALAAEALVESGKGQQAVALLRQYAEKLSKPAYQVGMAKALESTGDDIAAAGHYQNVYYGFPAWEKADEVSEALRRLKAKLGDRMPPAMPQMMLMRAKAFSDARKATEAKAELEAIMPFLTGADKELAQVRLGVADYQARRYQPAYNYLKSLTAFGPEAGAERLYYLIQACRRLARQAEIPEFLAAMAAKHPKSPLRLEALVDVAYDHLYRNEPESFRPLYRDCVDGFPGSRQASFCDWKTTWDNYLRGDTDKQELLKAHLKRFPESEKVPASLYFLGRLAERNSRLALARGYYQEVSHRFPNHYYSTLARKQMEQAKVAAAAADPSVAAFAASLNLPAKRKSVSFQPEPLTLRRMERAKLLEAADTVHRWAEEELRFGARNDAQPHLLAVRLAAVLEGRGASDEALRAVKGLVPDYLMYPMEDAPAEFWRVAFPMPFRDLVVRNARMSELDPFVVAGLIRQESEFNPKAISRAYALGLTQVLPSTGRELSRRTGIRPFQTAMLFQPDVNLRLGTFYIRQLLNSFSGKWEQALASYNGGRTRVLRWEEWGNFQEPAEFIETIPIAETRDYVQIVMRNATVYRQLYQGLPLDVTSGNEPAPPAAPKAAVTPKPVPKPAAKAPARKSGAATRAVPQRKNVRVH